MFDLNISPSHKRVAQLAKSALDIRVMVVRAQQYEGFLSFDCSGRSMTYKVYFILRDRLDLFPLAYLASLNIPLVIATNEGYALSVFVFRLSY